MAAVAQVRVQDHCFIVGDASDATPPFDLLDWTSGIAGAMPSALLVDAGIQSGTVSVTVTVTDDRPPLETPQQWATTAEWDDIAEVSVNAPQGTLTVEQLQYPPGTEPLSLPVLSPQGPGCYRLRLHAAGRDQQYDQIAEDSDVRLLIAAWPSPFSAPLIIKSTSMCGYGLRLSELQRSPNGETIPVTVDQRDQAARDALIRRTLLTAHQRPDHGQRS